jgi:hypothetical protein
MFPWARAVWAHSTRSPGSRNSHPERRWRCSQKTLILAKDLRNGHLGKVLGEARKINPSLAFVPCSYSPRVTPQFAERYRGLIDGILFPYRAELTGANLTDPTLVDAEVATLKTILGPSVPVIVDVYASAHSRLGSSTPEYVEAVMNRAIRCADGVHVYCHHSPRDGSQKGQVIKRLFHAWSADPSIPRPRG